MIVACILNWKRPKNLEKIVKSLKKQNIINEIIIWNNAKDIIELSGCSVINSSENIMCYGRYEAIFKSFSNVFYIQDDDCIVKNIEFLYSQYLIHPRTIHSNLSKSANKRGIKEYVGHGAIFNKKLLRCFDLYKSIYPIDNLFLRESDLIFSMLNQKINYLVSDDELEQLPKLNVSLCKEPNHIMNRKLMKKRIKLMPKII